MNFDRGLRRRLERDYTHYAKHVEPIIHRAFSDAAFRREIAAKMGKTTVEAIKILELEYLEYMNALQVLRAEKTLVFAHDQAQIFWGIAKDFRHPLEYRLPFESLWLQFDQPVPIHIGEEADTLLGICLHQEIVNADTLKGIENFRQAQAKGGTTLMTAQDFRIGEHVNVAVAIFGDTEMRKLTWSSESSKSLFEMISDDAISQSWIMIKNLAIACIGYVNCENVYMQEMGRVPDAVNRKRERKGKAKIEPYYVCRIQGVDYSSEGRGQGSGHGFRYDVRGHFRHLESGKTTWVRPHQRGLAHELYVPKIYALAGKGSGE